MLFFLLYQALPLALLWLALERLCRHPRLARWAAPAVFILGAAAQFILWGRSRPDLENPDSLGFWRIGHGLETDLRSFLYRPKLYPWFLGPFATPKAAAFAQCLLKLGMGGWILRAARALGWRPATAAFVLALFLVHNLWLREPLRILDTALFGFLFLGALVLAMEAVLKPGPARFAAFCAAAALTSLCRQIADPLLIAIGAVCLAKTIAARPARWPLPAAAAVAGLCLAASGALANGLSRGAYVRSVALGVNIYTHYAYYELADPSAGEWGFVEARLPEARSGIPPWRTEWRADMPWSVNALPHHLERALGSSDLRAIRAADSLLARRALDGMAGKPARYLSAFANEWARLLSKCEGDYPTPFLARGRAAIRLERGLTHIPLWLMLLAAGVGWLSAPGRRLALALPLAAALGYLALIAAIQIGLGRYGMPAWILLLPPAGHALDRVSSLIEYRSSRDRPPGLAVRHAAPPAAT